MMKKYWVNKEWKKEKKEWKEGVKKREVSGAVPPQPLV